MPEQLLTLAASALCFLGCAVLALSQRGHWSAAVSRLPYPAPGALCMLRLVAFLMLGGALSSCIGGHGTGFGLLLWVFLLSAGGIGMAFVLAWRPRWLRPLAFFMCNSV